MGLSGPRERSLILQPSAARRRKVSQLLTCGQFHCFTSRDTISDYISVSLSQISTEGVKTNFKSISCPPAEGDRWWEGGSHRTSGMPVAASVVI